VELIKPGDVLVDRRGNASDFPSMMVMSILPNRGDGYAYCIGGRGGGQFHEVEYLTRWYRVAPEGDLALFRRLAARWFASKAGAFCQICGETAFYFYPATGGTSCGDCRHPQTGDRFVQHVTAANAAFARSNLPKLDEAPAPPRQPPFSAEQLARLRESVRRRLDER